MKVSELAALPPVDRVQRIWRRLIPLAQSGYEGFPPHVRTFFAVFEWLGEVSNGGLHQYFSNSSGDRAADALAGLHFLRALKAARCLDQALQVDGRTGEAEIRRLEALSDEVNALAAGVIDALAQHAAQNVATFAFLDRYPGGFKALPLPDAIDLAPAWEQAWDPFEIVTYAYARLHDRKTEPAGATRDFLDVFAFADEVSAAGFESYLASADGPRHRRVAELLEGWGLGPTAALLIRATSTRGLGREFQAHRADVAARLARFVLDHRPEFTSR